VGWDMVAGVVVASTSVATLIGMIAAAPRATARLSALCSLTDITVLTSALSRRPSALCAKGSLSKFSILHGRGSGNEPLAFVNVELH